MNIEDWVIVREPDDKMADVRISMGWKQNVGAYIVFRGRPEQVKALLEVALEEAGKSLPRGNYTDKRNRPQG